MIGALLYFGRCVTMFVTQVPKADPNYHCSPKVSVSFWRGLDILNAFSNI